MKKSSHEVKREAMEAADSAITTMTDDIKVTIDDVLTVKDELVQRIIGLDESKIPDMKELLIAIYIRGFFTGAHLKAEDESALNSDLMLEVVKAKLEKGSAPN
jgi:hypothetical protein